MPGRGDERLQHGGGQPRRAPCRPRRRPGLRPELLPHRGRRTLRPARGQRLLQQEGAEKHLAEETQAGHRQERESRGTAQGRGKGPRGRSARWASPRSLCKTGDSGSWRPLGAPRRCPRPRGWAGKPGRAWHTLLAWESDSSFQLSLLRRIVEQREVGYFLRELGKRDDEGAGRILSNFVLPPGTLSLFQTLARWPRLSCLPRPPVSAAQHRARFAGSE